MAYSATLNGEVFFSTDSMDQALALSSATLELKAGAAGLFSFTVLPSNKKYDEFTILSDYVDVYRNQEPIFYGRVTSITQNFDLSYNIEAQGLLSILNDTIFRPMTHEGTLYQLVSELLSSHNSQVENAKKILLGDIQISDAPCYRAYENYESTFSRFSDLVDSFGGYLSIRKHAGHLYLDWKPITIRGAQSVDFGENLLNITKASESENYITVLIPLGAEVEDEETGERSRITIESVNGGKDYITLPEATNKIVGTYTWDDVTEPSNLLDKGFSYLQAQGILRTKIDVTAIDLADAGYDIDNFEVGTVIEVTSRPHGLDAQTFECMSQSLDLLSPNNDNLSLGGTVDGFTIRAKKEARFNAKAIEKIEASYSTNQRLNDIKATLDDQIQENSTLIEQNSENIVILSEQVQTAAKIFYEQPVPPYSEGDLWYRGHTSEDIYSAVPGYAIPGYAIPGVGGDLYICTNPKDDDESFDISDWKATFKGQLVYLNRRITSAKIDVDATKGQIALLAYDMNMLTGRVRSAELSINSFDASINAVARSVSTLTGRVQTAEMNIDAANQQIALKVSNSDYNAATIVAKINGASSSVTISADHIKLEGIVTANNRFKILSDGSMVATNGTFTGVINATAGGTIGGFDIGSTYLRYGDGSTGITMSSATFTRAIGGTNRANLYFAMGNAFAIANNGTVYVGPNVLSSTTFSFYSDTTDYLYQASLSAGNGLYLSRYDKHRQSYATTDITTQHVNTSGTGRFYGICQAARFISDESTSDIRKKQDIEEIPNEISEQIVYSLRPVSFRYIKDPTLLHRSFIAQDIEKVRSEYVSDDWDIVYDVEDLAPCGKIIDTYKALSHIELLADIVGTLQSQNRRIRALEALIKEGTI